jgi:hypothetical protein
MEGNADRNGAIQILSLEYQTLRDELIARIAGRFQFLGLTTTAAAILVTGLFGNPILRSDEWIAAILAMTVFVFGLANFLVLGRHVILLSAKIAKLEYRINSLASFGDDEAALLSWESAHQERGFLDRISMGLLARRV